MILSLLLACAAETTPPADDTEETVSNTVPEPGTDTSEPGTTGGETDETAAPSEEEPTEENPPDDDTPEELPAPDKESEDLSETYFSLDQVHAIELQLSDEALGSLRRDPYTDVAGDMTLNGELIEDVNVRLKGRVGSFRSLSLKAGFKVDINDNVPGRTVMGQKKLNLNNLVQDCSFIHDRSAYLLYEAMGVSAPRVGYGWVTVNGEDYGLYGLVEQYDDIFLKYRYEQPDGNLYDGDYIELDDGSYILPDFEAPAHDFFKLSEGVDVGLEDVRSVTVAIQKNASVGDVVDLEQFQRFWATEAWVGQWDGYNYNQNNYRVYFNPETGLAELFPWDHDNSFYPSIALNNPKSRLGEYCELDPDCYQGFRDGITKASATVVDIGLLDEINRAIALITPYVVADPRKELSVADVEDCQADVRDWIEDRESDLAVIGL